MLNQLAGVGMAWGISIVGTLILLFVVDKIMGLRVTPEQERPGSIFRSTAKKATISIPSYLMSYQLSRPFLRT
jgi:ammonia channel protein AmtB